MIEGLRAFVAPFYVCDYTRVELGYIYIYIHVYTYWRLHPCVCVCVFKYACIFIYIYVGVHVCMYVYYVSVCSHRYIHGQHTYLGTCTNTCVYAHVYADIVRVHMLCVVCGMCLMLRV